MATRSASEPTDKPPLIDRFRLHALWPLALTLLGTIAIVGWLSYRSLAAQAVEQISANLSTIASARASAIQRWRQDRLEHGRDVGRDPYIVDAVSAIQSPAPAPETTERLLEWMRLQRAAHGFFEILLLDTDLTLLATDPPDREPIDPDRASLAREALLSGEPHLTGLHLRHTGSPSQIGPHLGVIAPVGRMLPNGDFAATGLIILRLNPSRSLFPALDNWPTPSTPGRLQLVERGPDGLRIAVESLAPGASPSARRMDLELPHGEQLLDLKAPGPITANDGEAMLAVAYPIADSHWTLLAQIPGAIVDAARHRIVANVALIAGLAAISTLVGVGFLWWRLRGSMYRRLWRRERDLSGKLAQEREQLTGLFDGVDELIYVADPHTFELVYVNQHFRNILGNDSLGRRCHKVLQNRDEPCPFCTNDKIFGEYLGRSYVWEFQNEVTKRWYRCTDKAIKWTDGRLVRFELASDITDQRSMDQQRIQLEKLSALGQLTAGVAHELNNPLMGVINGIQYCQAKTPKDAPLHEVLENAEHHTRRCVKIVDGLLEFSRNDHPSEAASEQLDAAALLERVTRLLDYRFKKTGITVDRQVAEDLGDVWLPGGQFEQILVNLLSNAIDALADHPDKRIDLALRRDDDSLLLEVRDHGVGMDEATKARIFEPFFTTKPPGKGTGLGLSTTWSIVATLGGTMNVESDVGKGTYFQIRLPQPSDTNQARPNKAQDGDTGTTRGSPDLNDNALRASQAVAVEQ